MRPLNLAQNGSDFLRGECTAAEAVGDPVYISGDRTGDVYPVRKADADDEDKMPAVGIIIQKLTATDCVVQMQGPVYGIFSGLDSKIPYKVGNGGGLSRTAPVPGVNGYAYIQFMGKPLSDDVFFVRPDNLITIRRS